LVVLGSTVIGMVMVMVLKTVTMIMRRMRRGWMKRMIGMALIVMMQIGHGRVEG